MIQLLRKCLYIFLLKVIPQSVKNLVLCGYWNHIRFQEALTQASCENPGVNLSNCDPTHHVVDGKVVLMDLND